MQRLNCYDASGNSINALTQWDTNQTIYINNINFSSPPVAFFDSHEGNFSYVVNTEIIENKVRIVVPNLLLQLPSPISIGIGVLDSSDKITRTKYFIRLPIRVRQMPSNYIYTENVDNVTLSSLQTQLNGKLNTSQGTANANKIVAIGANGNITFLTLGTGLTISNGILSAT